MSQLTRDPATPSGVGPLATTGQAVQVLPTEMSVDGLRVLGWWHEPSQVLGPPVLLCGPWGDEAVGAYRGQYELAQGLAGAGWPVLRFDWPGDGDSDDPAAPGALPAAWVAAVGVAVAHAQRQQQRDSVWLLGVHWGGLVAAQALAQGLAVTGLVLLAPPTSGRAWLREARLLNQGLGPPPAEPGAVRVGGLDLPAAAAEAVAGWTWDGLSQARAVLACPRADRPWPVPVAAVGMALRPRTDLAELTATAHVARWPDGLADELLAWMSRHTAWPLATRPSGRPPDPVPSATGSGSPWRERPVDYGAGRWAVLTEPAQTRPGGQALLLLSSGAERRIGPHRLWVDWARQRASQGDRVLRIDLQGFGDSAADTGASGEASLSDRIYSPQRRRDLGDAVDWLRQQAGVRRVAVLGLCSGAHHAWRAAVEGLAVDRVVPVNPLVFHWQPGTPLDPTRLAFGQLSIADGAARSLRDPARWAKLLRGQVRLGVILPAVAARLRLALRARLRDLARRGHWPLADDLGTELRQLARRGLKLHFVFAEGDPGQALLQQEAGSVLGRLMRDGHVHLATVASADHTFSWPQARQALYKQLDAVLADGVQGAEWARSPVGPAPAVQNNER